MISKVKKLVRFFAEKSKKPILFNDRFGNSFLLYKDIDNLSVYKKRKSVTDAINIINYLNKTLDGGLCFDIGANIGGVSVAIKKNIQERGFLVAVEPDPKNTCRVIQNLMQNGFLDQYHVFQFAVSDVKADLDLKVFPKANGWQTIGLPVNHMKGKYYESIKIKTVTFPDLVRILNFDGKRIELVKIDVEGAELNVLTSMRSLLEKEFVGRVIFEVSDLTLEGFGHTKEMLINFWSSLNYTLHVIRDTGDLELLDDVNLAEEVHFDCVALLK